MRRDLLTVDTDKPLGSVSFDGKTLALDGQAADVFGGRRQLVGDRALGESLMSDGWSNGYLYLGGAEARLTMDYPVDVTLPDDTDEVQAAAGVDTHPGGEELKHYWLHGDGAAKWSTWTELYHHLVKYLSPEMAKRTAAQWFHERYGDWPGSDTNLVRHGKPPRGHVVGPG